MKLGLFRAASVVLLFTATAPGMRATPSFALSTGSPSCGYTNFGFLNGACTNLLPSNLAGVGGLQGITFYLSGVDTSGLSQSTPNALTDFEGSGSTITTTIQFSVSGKPNNPNSLPPIASGASIPLYWDFYLSVNNFTFTSPPSNASLNGTFTVTFNLLDVTTGQPAFGGPVTFSGAALAGQIAGFGSATTIRQIDPADNYAASAGLSVTWTRLTGTPGLIVTIPPGSLDLKTSRRSQLRSLVHFG